MPACWRKLGVRSVSVRREGGREIYIYIYIYIQRERERDLTTPTWRYGDRKRKEGLSNGCKLCGGKQTLIHVLNNCPVALEMRRYCHRHDCVLSEIVDFIKSHLPPASNIMADLPGAPCQYPPDIGTTDLRPDIIIWQGDGP